MVLQVYAWGGFCTQVFLFFVKLRAFFRSLYRLRRCAFVGRLRGGAFRCRRGWWAPFTGRANFTFLTG